MRASRCDTGVDALHATASKERAPTLLALRADDPPAVPTTVPVEEGPVDGKLGLLALQLQRHVQLDPDQQLLHERGPAVQVALQERMEQPEAVAELLATREPSGGNGAWHGGCMFSWVSHGHGTCLSGELEHVLVVLIVAM